MAESRTYNTFYKGILEDDFLTNGANFIEGNNVTGLNTGYALTLGPKVDEQLLTNGNAPRTIFGSERSSGSLEDMAVGCDTGEIYKLDGADNVPIYTLTNAWDIINGALLQSGSNFMYFASKQPGVSFTSARLMQVTLTDFRNETFASVNETFLSFDNLYTPPMLIDGSVLFVGGLGTVYRISNTGVTVSAPIFNRYVTGITKQGTQYVVYTDEGFAFFWDGVSTTTFTGSKELGFRPARVTSTGSTDHIISTDGDYYVGSGYTFQLVSQKRSSRRLNDNSQYIKKIDFTPDFITGQSISSGRGGEFFVSSDTKPGIYRRERLIQGLPESFHKSIAKDNGGFDFDEVFTSTYLSKGQSLLMVGKQANTTSLGVDKIDFNANTTAKDGYAVTDIFSGGTTFRKQIDKFRITTSNTSGTNYIKLYFRKNNASTWTLARTINNTTDEIDRASISEVTGNFIDIQFKVELHNDNQDDTPPFMHELYLEYTINKNNG